MAALVAGLPLGCSDSTASEGTSDGTSPPADAGTVEPPEELLSGPLVDFVDPFIGTGGAAFGAGAAYPGPAMPFGMIHPGPDTGTNGRDADIFHFSGYHDGDDEIFGFAHLRLQGTGVPDMGNLLVMPTDGFVPSMATGQGYRSKFSKSTETASPGYYGVTLDDSQIRVELTTSRRAALHRYTFPAGSTPTIVFDPTHFAGTSGTVASASARVDPDGRVFSYVDYQGPLSRREKGVQAWLVAEADRTIESSQTFSDGVVADGTEFNGTFGGVAVRLAGGEGTVHLRVAVSFISEEQAVRNLETEAPDYDFDAMHTAVRETWEGVLSKIRIAGGTDAQQRIFYSALYRSFLMPNLYTEVGGHYRGIDGELHQSDDYDFYSDLSLWDTFRTLHPLMNLISERHARDFAISIQKMIEHGGAVPRWPLAGNYTNTMIGSSADITVAETYLKGITDFDAESMYQAMKRQAMEARPDGARGPWRSGIEDYVALGYVPDEVSETLEYSYDDWALSLLADALGHTADAAMFQDRGQSWKRLWSDEHDLILPRDSAGNFPASIDDRTHGGPYVEGNALQWSWYVPHDGAGLREAFGSDDAFVQKLREFFDKSTTLVYVEEGAHHILPDTYYWHSNEPVIHAAYLFNDVDRPDLARHYARVALDTQYRDAPDGLPGNDDSGTMSAWYVFAAMGFYPIAGGTEYWLGQPIFRRVVLTLPDGELEIRAPEASDGIDLPAITIDGESVVGRFDHSQIRSGARIDFGAAE